MKMLKSQLYEIELQKQQEARTVKQKNCQTNKTHFPGARIGTVPSVRVWHGTGEVVGSPAGTLTPHWK